MGCVFSEPKTVPCVCQTLHKYFKNRPSFRKTSLDLGDNTRGKAFLMKNAS